MKKIVIVLAGLMVSGASMQAINVRPQRPAPTPAPVKTMPVVVLPVRPVIVPEVEQPVVAMPVVEQPAQPEMPVAVMEPEVTMPEIPANATPEQKKGIVAQMKGKARAGYDTAKKWVGAHKKEVAAAVGVGAVAAGAAVGARQYKKGQQRQQGLEGQQGQQEFEELELESLEGEEGVELVPQVIGEESIDMARTRMYGARTSKELQDIYGLFSDNIKSSLASEFLQLEHRMLTPVGGSAEE